MKKEVKEKWLKALRSGEYKQGTDKLRDKNDCFCCLGVLCDIFVQETNNTEWKQYGTHKYSVNVEGEFNSGLYPPDAVADWAEIDDKHYKVKYPSIDKPISIAYLNDDKGLSFKELADLIEEQL